jgi:hypothetical protein
VLTGELGVVMVAVPEISDHKPVPEVGTVAAKVVMVSQIV